MSKQEINIVDLVVNFEKIVSNIVLKEVNDDSLSLLLYLWIEKMIRYKRSDSYRLYVIFTKVSKKFRDDDYIILDEAIKKRKTTILKSVPARSVSLVKYFIENHNIFELFKYCKHVKGYTDDSLYSNASMLSFTEEICKMLDKITVSFDNWDVTAKIKPCSIPGFPSGYVSKLDKYISKSD
ncbi:hypothetical protein ADUPG1_012299, partial [Aduncisulcus paluster]